jgi:hypothetical protein
MSGGSRHMKLQVRCYAGRKANERPVRFQLKDRDYLLKEVLDQYYDPVGSFFNVRADDGNPHILRHNTKTDEW